MSTFDQFNATLTNKSLIVNNSPVHLLSPEYFNAFFSNKILRNVPKTNSTHQPALHRLPPEHQLHLKACVKNTFLQTINHLQSLCKQLNQRLRWHFTHITDACEMEIKDTSEPVCVHWDGVWRQHTIDRHLQKKVHP